MDHLRGVVERIAYQNAENGYSVLRLRAKGFTDLITAVGNMADTHIGSVLTLTGAWRVAAKYGRQFSIESYEETLPATVYGIEKYLGSGLIRGIDPKYAKRIVQTFDAYTLTVIEEEPDRLIDVPGIGGRRVSQIKKAWLDGIALDHHKADSDSHACAEILLRYIQKEKVDVGKYIKQYWLK